MKSPALLLLALCAFAAATFAQNKPVSDYFAPIEDRPGLPRVLLIGDSISVGYTLPVRELLKDKANVHRIPLNGGPSSRGAAKIDEWVGDKKWDVVHFNFGLHDLVFLKEGRRQVEPADYEKNLRTVVAKLKTTGARLIWATTTPIPEGTRAPAFDRAGVSEYNAVAKRVMTENGVAIDDLNAAVTPRLVELQNPNDVHFKPESYPFLAKHVAASIEGALAAKK